MKATKLSRGVYQYRGYRISNCGYHTPDRCVWWEAVSLKTGCADYHANTKRELMEMINEDIEMKGVYRDCNIEVIRGGDEFISYSVIDETGYEFVSSFTESRDTVREVYNWMKKKVDEYRDNPDNFE